MNTSGATPAATAATGPSGEEAMDAGITVSLLTAVEAESGITQRSLSRQLGIALGLTNAYLKRCIGKGLIKIASAPANRYRYYLTPQGFAEKSRLTASYLSNSFVFLRLARADYEALFTSCDERNWRRIAFCGTGELADIALLSAYERRLEPVGIVAFEPDRGHHRLTVVTDPAALGPLDAVILTDHRAAQASFDRLAGLMDEARILTPRLLHVSRTRPRFAEAE